MIPRESKRHQAKIHLVRLGVTQASTRLGVTLAYMKCIKHPLPHRVNQDHAPGLHQDSRRRSTLRLVISYLKKRKCSILNHGQYITDLSCGSRISFEKSRQNQANIIEKP